MSACMPDLRYTYLLWAIQKKSAGEVPCWLSRLKQWNSGKICKAVHLISRPWMTQPPKSPLPKKNMKSHSTSITGLGANVDTGSTVHADRSQPRLAKRDCVRPWARHDGSLVTDLASLHSHIAFLNDCTALFFLLWRPSGKNSPAPVASKAAGVAVGTDSLIIQKHNWYPFHGEERSTAIWAGSP